MNCSSVGWMKNNFEHVIRKNISPEHTDLIDNVSLTGFMQFNYITNTYGKILDLIFYNGSSIYEITRCPTPAVKEDHLHPALDLLLKVNETKFSTCRFTENKG